jgi:hypothetical protein
MEMPKKKENKDFVFIQKNIFNSNIALANPASYMSYRPRPD